MLSKRINDFLPNIKDYYTIYEDGSIYSDNSGLMKTRNKGKTDYQLINFQTIENGKKTYRVHRLVLMAFNPIENMENFEINHIDGDKRNNNLNNLEWCTCSENQKHAFKIGLQKARKGEKSNFSKISKEDVIKIKELYNKGKTQQEIANLYNCTHSNISYIINNKTWQL